MFSGRRKIEELEYLVEKQERRADVLAEGMKELARKVEALEQALGALEARGPEEVLSGDEQRAAEEMRRQWANFWAYNGAQQRERGE